MTLTTIIGNLTRDPEERTSQYDGEVFASFTVAVNIRSRNGDRAQFYDCTAFGKQAENVLKYLRRGKKVCCVGTDGARAYARQDGSLAAQLTLKVDRIEFLSPAGDGSAPEDVPTEMTESTEEAPF